MYDNQRPGFVEQVASGVGRGAARRLAILGAILFAFLAVGLVSKFFVYFLALTGLAVVGFLARQMVRSYRLRKALRDVDRETGEAADTDRGA
jgi:hypothetical protein